jgi:NitT/TauT family transport system ATP-binding protein
MSAIAQPVSGSRSVAEAASVRAVDVSRTYRHENGRDLLAVDSVSLSVARSEFCSILGPSGCGKSTILMMMAGLYPTTSGQIFINETPVVGPFTDLGMVFQKDVLLDWRTVLNNVLLPIEIKRPPHTRAKETYRERALELLALVGLHDFASAYPEELSGGMRQRAAICRALVHDPPLLLMDEPFGALDALTRERLNLDLMRLTAESAKTVVFVTHSIEEAVLLSDQIVVLTPRPGKVLRSLPVDLPRPRSLATRADPGFHRLVNDIRDLFHSTGVI